MFDIFHVFDMILLAVLAVLIYKNRDWEYQPVFIICCILIVISIILTIVF